VQEHSRHVPLPGVKSTARSAYAHPRSARGSIEGNFHPAYRPDIDGLRAVAILSVVGFHVFPEWIHGGFVGVDVFFVISGFLISTIIFRSLADGTFSFFDFYAHRIRRIFPALVIVIAFCVVLGSRVLLPSEFEYLGTHVAASASFVENFVLSHESGYFNIASELKPLNHLWSLAIEEQFYAIFPPLMWIAWRLRFSLPVLVMAIFGLSFGANIIGIRQNDIATFFSLSTRAWELMAGALLAIASLKHGFDRYFDLIKEYMPSLRSCLPSISPAAMLQTYGRSLFSGAGLALIFYAVLAYNPRMPYPGMAAAAPVFGAVLLILSGPSAFVNRYLLSNRGAVWVGLISYPLYLWHWPLLSYLTIIDNATPKLYARVSVAALSFILAWLTYRYVERPVRATKTQRRKIQIALACAMIFFAIFGLNAKHLYGSYDPQTAKIMQYWNFRGYPGIDGGYIDSQYGFWAIGHNHKHKIFFLGDSHNEQYENTIARYLKEIGAEDAVEVMFSPEHALGFPPVLPPELINDRAISTVVISYFWALQYGGGQVNRAVRCCGTGLNGIVGVGGSDSPPERMDQFDGQFEALVTSLRNAGRQVYFVLDNPFGEELSPRTLLKRSVLHGISLVPTQLLTQTAIERAEPVRSRIVAIAHRTGAKIVDPIKYLCDQKACPALWSDGMPIYKDYDHLSDDTVINHVHYLDVILSANGRLEDKRAR
jgi:peptidoglycan/LPS O-acetylase OafA/YrhL